MDQITDNDCLSALNDLKKMWKLSASYCEAIQERGLSLLNNMVHHNIIESITFD